jgi:hypothetical protein
MMAVVPQLVGESRFFSKIRISPELGSIFSISARFSRFRNRRDLTHKTKVYYDHD